MDYWPALASRLYSPTVLFSEAAQEHLTGYRNRSVANSDAKSLSVYCMLILATSNEARQAMAALP
jgi:hypothetical protein